MNRRAAFAASPIGDQVLAGRPFPKQPGGRTADFDMSWQTSASKCREADETTSYVLVEAQYQDDLGEGDLSRLCGR